MCVLYSIYIKYTHKKPDLYYLVLNSSPSVEKNYIVYFTEFMFELDSVYIIEIHLGVKKRSVHLCV